MMDTEIALARVGRSCVCFCTECVLWVLWKGFPLKKLFFPLLKRCCVGNVVANCTFLRTELELSVEKDFLFNFP